MCAGGKGFQIFGHKRQNKAASFGCVLILFQSGFVNESTLEQIKRVEMIGDVFNGKGQTAIAVYCPCSICLCECEIEASGLGVAIVSVADSLCLAVLRGCRLFNDYPFVPVVTEQRDNGSGFGDFGFSVGITEAFAADVALPVFAVAVLGAGFGFRVDLGESVMGGNNSGGFGDFIFAVCVAEAFAADGALPVFAVAVLGAGRGGGFMMRERMISCKILFLGVSRIILTSV